MPRIRERRGRPAIGMEGGDGEMTEMTARRHSEAISLTAGFPLRVDGPSERRKSPIGSVGRRRWKESIDVRHRRDASGSN